MSRARPNSRYASAVSVLAVLRLKSPINGWPAVSFESMENAGAANENRALQTDQKIHDAALTRFQNARAGYSNLHTSCLHALHGRAQPVKIQIVQSDAIGLGGDCGFHLFRIADQHVELSVRPPQAGALFAPKIGRGMNQLALAGRDWSSSSFSTASRRIRFNSDTGANTEPLISALSPASSYGVLPSLPSCSFSVSSVSPRFCAALSAVGDSTVTASPLGNVQRVCSGWFAPAVDVHCERLL